MTKGLKKNAFFVFLLICVAVGNSSFGQFRKVNDTTIIFSVRNSLFNLIEHCADSIEIENIKEAIRSGNGIIYFESVDTSTFHYDNILQDSLMRMLILRQKNFIPDSICTGNVKKSICFIKKPLGKIKKSPCYMLILPLIEYRGNYFLKVNFRSKNWYDDMYGGTLCLFFNSELKLFKYINIPHSF